MLLTSWVEGTPGDSQIDQYQVTAEPGEPELAAPQTATTAGTARNGFSAEYRFAQLAYLSNDLDLFSLQEHDVTLSSAWTPTARASRSCVLSSRTS